MATQSIRIDDKVKDEATAIAEELGLTFSTVVNLLVRKFNSDGGFSFPIQIKGASERNAFTMSLEEIETAAQAAMFVDSSEPAVEYVTMFDEETGKFCKRYWDGRVEYVL